MCDDVTSFSWTRSCGPLVFCRPCNGKRISSSLGRAADRLPGHHCWVSSPCQSGEYVIKYECYKRKGIYIMQFALLLLLFNALSFQFYQHFIDWLIFNALNLRFGCPSSRTSELYQIWVCSLQRRTEPLWLKSSREGKKRAARSWFLWQNYRQRPPRKKIRSSESQKSSFPGKGGNNNVIN